GSDRAESVAGERLERVVTEACAGLPGARATAVLREVRRNLYPGISADEVSLAQIMAARTLVERDPDYSRVAARLLLDRLRGQALTALYGTEHRPDQRAMAVEYPRYFAAYLE